MSLGNRDAESERAVEVAHKPSCRSLFPQVFLPTSWPSGLSFPLAPRVVRPPFLPTTMSSGASSKARLESRRESAAPSTTETLPAPPAQPEEKKAQATPKDAALEEWKDFGFLPIPKRVRYDPDRPAHFGLLMNAIFGVASTFSMSFLFASPEYAELKAA